MLQNRENVLLFQQEKRCYYSLLTLIERPGQEDCRQDQEDHVPREPVPHLREVPSPPGKETFGLCRNIRLTTHCISSLLLCQCVYDVSRIQVYSRAGRTSFIMHRKLGRQRKQESERNKKTRFSFFCI